ncbi:nuclear transport factor 2 family protein [Phreatobacter stygius]|uniref:Nuclear transport factor 2 family protein n=1 Tax=Phreatobacter stygius TaxID=1940610 RepID=A0A4D7B7Y7_9HYPH|nr:nuclear transport factor 2 family protein [Phreatobacter stygius]QCI64252.1 nuclear transport factor 2 family protein [Phreatobacter stygius]
MSLDILDRWYAALKAGDAQALSAVTTEDVTLRWNGPVGIVPWAGLWQGRAKVITFFKRVADHLDIVSMETVQRIETPGAVALVLDGHWRVRATGEELQVRAVNLFRFEDGRVAAYEIYPDSFAFAQALARV